MAMIYCRIPRLRVKFQRDIIAVGLLQFILYVYMVISVRVSNHGLLNDASLKGQWGFGQILALIMAGSTIVESVESLEGQ